MNLPEYIKRLGDQEAAKRFGASLHTVRSWRRRTRFPRPEKAAEIVALTQGAIDMNDIYGPAPASEEADRAA